MSHVLTADGGTESLRVRIYDLDGRCVASHAEPYETKFMAGARAEQNAEDWWSSLVTATQICLKEANISGDAIDAMAYATTCCTVVALAPHFERQRSGTGFRGMDDPKGAVAEAERAKNIR